jgi:ketosteroid isomerase-like protein
MRNIPDIEIQLLLRELDRGRDDWIHGNPALEATSTVAQSDRMTIFAPFGGEALRNGPDMERRQLTAASQFHGGTGRSEVVDVLASGDLVVVILVERSEVRFSPDGPLQPWVLRTTQVFRREGERWIRLHRHADPLIKFRPLAETSALARGESI